MLVLARHRNEAIKIGEDIEVHILCLTGNVVKVGVKAPDEIKILRKELERTDDEKCA